MYHPQYANDTTRTQAHVEMAMMHGQAQPHHMYPHVAHAAVHHTMVPQQGTSSAAAAASALAPAVVGSRKPVRDSKRRATHSQIERRRREKINDRLVTLRTIVPACAAEVEERKRIRREEEEEARRIAAGEITASSIGRGGKRKRNRRRASAAVGQSGAGQGGKGDASAKEEELGLHKLEVLTHAIDYIYELQARIQELETGFKSRAKRVKDDEDREEGLGDGEADDDDETEIIEHVSQIDHRNLIKSEYEHPSELHMEMTEWRSANSASRPNMTRRSTVSSSDDASSSRITSPLTFMRNHAHAHHEEPSPLFSATANSSNSNITALTSPMMSLSAESPILNLFANGGNGVHVPISGQDSEVPSPRSHKDADKTARTAHPSAMTDATPWPMLPEPAMQAESKGASRLSEASRRASNADASVEARSARAATTDAKQHDDARLLLAFSTSPEVLRPTSAVRQTFVDDAQKHRPASFASSSQQLPRQRRRLSTTAALTVPATSASALVSPQLTFTATSRSQRRNDSISATRHRAYASHAGLGNVTSSDVRNTALRTGKVAGRSVVLGSAPGGAHPSSSTHSLPSPPTFALDDDTAAPREGMDVDRN